MNAKRKKNKRTISANFSPFSSSILTFSSRTAAEEGSLIDAPTGCKKILDVFFSSFRRRFPVVSQHFYFSFQAVLEILTASLLVLLWLLISSSTVYDLLITT